MGIKMALGIMRRIENKGAKISSSSSYLFCKMEEKYDGKEEYWLITDHQLETFLDRAIDNCEDIPQDLERGYFVHVKNKKAKKNANEFYIAASLELEEEDIDLLLTSNDLEVIRERVADNIEDIEANKESWFFDLFD